MPAPKRFNFDLLTMIALLASASLLCALPSNPQVVFALVMIVLPISIMLIAITSPKDGTYLNITSRWYIYLLGKTWCFTVGFYFLAVLVVCFFAAFMPGLGYRLQRMSQGDFRAHVFHVEVQLDGLTPEDFDRNVTPVYDERGLVGECSRIYVSKYLDNNNAIVVTPYMRIHTDRLDLPPSGECCLYRRDGKIMLKKTAKQRGKP